jgi:ribonucleotide monophosphatase NagD (HAD superfamily)
MDVRGLLIDIDGVLAVSWQPLPGAIEALRTVDEAGLLAMHANLFWRTADGLQLDAVAFLSGLERAAGVRATVLGKPAGAFFATALSGLGAAAEHVVMVGDDVESDVVGAQRHGLTGVLVRTGKFLPDHEDGVDGVQPHHVLDSIADLPGFLGLA